VVDLINKALLAVGVRDISISLIVLAYGVDARDILGHDQSAITALAGGKSLLTDTVVGNGEVILEVRTLAYGTSGMMN
jgi:hypothetical protein